MQQKKYAQIGEYFLEKTLGKGNQAKVKLGFKANDPNTKYAIKLYPIKNPELYQQTIEPALHEINLMKNLKHKNIIQLVEVIQNQKYIKKNGESYDVFAVVMEYAESGEVFDYVYQGHFTEKEARTYFRQLLDGINYIHSQGITHRDLKPENLLFDKFFNLKIADFGLSQYMSKYSTGRLKTMVGTNGYMAPEQIKGAYVGSCIDIFAAGIVLFVFYSKIPPFRVADPKQCEYFKLLATHKLDEFWTTHKNMRQDINYSPGYQDFINCILAYDPAQRITMAEIISHPWFQGDLATREEIQTEFLKRREFVNQEQQKQLLQRKIEKQKQKQQNRPGIMYTGMQGYRSASTVEEEFSDITEKFENLEIKSRKIKPFTGQPQIQDIIRVVDKEYLLKFLLNEHSQFSSTATLSDKKYRISCEYVDEDEDITELKYEINLLEVDEDTVCIDMLKIEGDSEKYYNCVQKIREITEQI